MTSLHRYYKATHTPCFDHASIKSPTCVVLYIRGTSVYCASSLRSKTKAMPAPRQPHHDRLGCAIQTIIQDRQCGHCNSEGCAEPAVLDFAFNSEDNLNPRPDDQEPFELIYAVRWDNPSRRVACTTLWRSEKGVGLPRDNPDVRGPVHATRWR
jgi:hypothetical protein